MSTTKIEKVKPVKIEDIEFYCSRDGEQTGMSQSGLARFSGVSHVSVYRCIKLVEQVPQDDLPEWLKPWKLVGIYHSNLTGVNDSKGAQILKADFCADYIEQLAFHPEKPNATSLSSFRKFARIGINSFIKDVTGYRDLTSSEADIKAILGVVKSMEKKLDASKGYFQARVQYPGLEEICRDSGLSEQEEELLLLTPVEKLLTLNECVSHIYPGMSLSKTQKHSLAILVGQAYKTLKLGSPVKVVRHGERGYALPPVYGYPERMLGVIKMLFTTMLNTTAIS